jgi:predicted nuclease of predicted toxin-antitoxin system
VKLLLDANLSPRLLARIEATFPESSHVFAHEALRRDDRAIWEFAKRNGFTIISKDGDFHQMSILHGAPPKLVWVRAGNASTDEISRLILDNRDWIIAFGSDDVATFLVL